MNLAGLYVINNFETILSLIHIIHAHFIEQQNLKYSK
jgi:hypothetical protein